MSDYDNSWSGVLFKNDRKQKPTQPDYTGTFTDGDGVERWFSSWLKEGKNGKKFMSCSVGDPKDAPRAAPAADDIGGDIEEDIPFSNYELRTIA